MVGEKEKLLIVLIIVLLLFGVVIACAGMVFWKFYYSDIQPPLIEEGETSISGVDDFMVVGGYPVPTEVTFTVTKIIENPNQFEIEVTKVEYEYYINDNFIEDGKIYREYRIPANDRRDVPIKIKTDPATLVSMAKAGLVDAKEGRLTIKVYCDVHATASLRKTVVASKTSESELDYLTFPEFTDAIKKN